MTGWDYVRLLGLIALLLACIAGCFWFLRQQR